MLAVVLVLKEGGAISRNTGKVTVLQYVHLTSSFSLSPAVM